MEKSSLIDFPLIFRLMASLQPSEAIRAVLNLMSSSEDKDTVISTSGGNLYQCHSALLALASPFLKDMLAGAERDEGGGLRLCLPDVYGSSVDAFLDVLYCNISVPSDEQLSDLASLLCLDFTTQHFECVSDVSQQRTVNNKQKKRQRCDLDDVENVPPIKIERPSIDLDPKYLKISGKFFSIQINQSVSEYFLVRII